MDAWMQHWHCLHPQAQPWSLQHLRKCADAVCQTALGIQVGKWQACHWSGDGFVSSVHVLPAQHSVLCSESRLK